MLLCSLSDLGYLINVRPAWLTTMVGAPIALTNLLRIADVYLQGGWVANEQRHRVGAGSA